MVAYIRYKIIAMLLAAITALSLQPADPARILGGERSAAVEPADGWTLSCAPEWLDYYRALQSMEKPLPLSAATAKITRDFTSRLILLEEEYGTPFELEGETADWTDVLAVYTALFYNGRLSLAVDSLRQLSPEKVYLLELVYFNMNEVQTVFPEKEEPEENSKSGESAETEDNEPEPEPFTVILKARTAEELRNCYPLNETQTLLLDRILSNRDTIHRFLTDFSALTAEAAGVMNALPEDLPAERRAVVQAACSMVGKISFFWGGKSLLYGWDADWGTLKKVEAEGSRTTGHYRIYGLDCSGFVDRAFFNANGTYFGGGTKVQFSTCTPVEMEKAQPGDLLFRYDENGVVSHIGIVCGRDAEGGLRVIHCNSQDETVVITDAEIFQLAGRPSCYREEYGTEEEPEETEEISEQDEEETSLNIETEE